MNKTIRSLGVSVALVGTLGLFSFKSTDNLFEISKNLEIFSAIVREVNGSYVENVEPAKLIKTGIDAMLKSLDPYTDYYSESEIEDYRFMTTGQYGGIGSTIAKQGDYIVINEPYDGWPAQMADLRAGDMILEIDGKSMKGKSIDEVSKLLKGQADTKLTLRIQRFGVASPINKELTRREVKVKNVPYYGMINPDYGYILFSGFRQQAAKEVADALKSLKDANPGMKGLVLDLRGNPGGLLDEAIKAVGIFVDKGQLVVKTKGKLEDANQSFYTENSPSDTKIPVAVLIDGGSASASEIVSGSLQDLDRAVVLGTNSFGKGLVQSTKPLPYGTQMKLTTSKYYIPSGRCIQAIDYGNKDEKGAGIKKADSLRAAFKTKSGRVVYDGNGIKPDVEVNRAKYSKIAVSLSQKQLIFDYATRYRSTHESIPAAKNFQISDADFKDFMAFIKDKKYEYSTETEQIVAKLENTAKDEKYYEALKSDIKALADKLKEDKDDDILKHKEEIKNLLKMEICSRYYYQAGRIQASFDFDSDLAAALKLLGNAKEYQAILSAAK